MDSSTNRRPGRYFVSRTNGGLIPRESQFPGPFIDGFRTNSRVAEAAADLRDCAELVADMEHTPRRPWWTCTHCQHAWPCPPARDGLRRRIKARALAIYMTGQLGAAVKDMPRAAPGALWRRFLAWTYVDHGSNQLAP